MINRLKNFLTDPIDGASVAFIRISFAAVMVYWFASHIILGKIEYNYYEPSFLFPYGGFEWVQLWEGRWLHLHFLVGLVAALGMMFGVFYRFSAVIFAIAFTYIFLLDKATYQNHYYFVSLMSILFAISPAERVLSFDAIRKKLPHTIPRWVLLLLQFQIGLVYFFGGVAKMNLDWISGFPMRQVLANKTEHLLIGPFCTQEWFVMFFVWSGMLFDLLIVPLLMWKRTRILAFCMALTFHLLNASLFRIGIFPWAMIFLTTIYFEPDWPRRLLGWLFGSAPESLKPAKHTGPVPFSRKVLYGFVCVFVFIQVALPFRHLALAENTSWTERHHHFSWHMKLRAKNSVVRFYAFHEKSGQASLFKLQDHLKLHQLLRMSRDPWMIRSFARFVESEILKEGFSEDEIAVRVFALSSLNGRTPQLLIDPKVDLTQDKLPDGWIMPLKESIGGDFNEPFIEWERIVMKDPYFDSHLALAKAKTKLSNPKAEANQTKSSVNNIDSEKTQVN